MGHGPVTWRYRDGVFFTCNKSGQCWRGLWSEQCSGKLEGAGAATAVSPPSAPFPDCLHLLNLHPVSLSRQSNQFWRIYREKNSHHSSWVKLFQSHSISYNLPVLISLGLPGSSPCCHDLYSLFHSQGNILQWIGRQTEMALESQGPSQSLPTGSFTELRQKKSCMHFPEKNVCSWCVKVVAKPRLTTMSDSLCGPKYYHSS